MKLRNKKTGEIFDYIEDIMPFGLGSPFPKSLAELCENWEDYEPKEPLIKDLKICKAVRAWAEAIGTTSAFVERGSFDNEHLELSDALNRICFVAKRPKDIKPGIRYTIEELCGEEEE